jgi:hypothetical protein
LSASTRFYPFLFKTRNKSAATTTNGKPGGTLKLPRSLAQDAPLAHPLQQADGDDGARL